MRSAAESFCCLTARWHENSAVRRGSWRVRPTWSTEWQVDTGIFLTRVRPLLTAACEHGRLFGCILSLGCSYGRQGQGQVPEMHQDVPRARQRRARWLPNQLPALQSADQSAPGRGRSLHPPCTEEREGSTRSTAGAANTRQLRLGDLIGCLTAPI